MIPYGYFCRYMLLNILSVNVYVPHFPVDGELHSEQVTFIYTLYGQKYRDARPLHPQELV